MAQSTVVVTDTSSPRALQQTLGFVVRTVPGTTEVVVVSPRSLKLDGALARRVRRVRVRGRSEVQDAALAEVRTDRLTAVLGAGCHLSPTWWADAEDAAHGRPTAVTDLGEGAARVLVHPVGVIPTARRPVPVSASLIVKDEEEVIGECLAALARFVDEVVVYDTGSTDATVALARAAGARVVEGHWDDDFGAARNRSLAHCTHDWVLCVDADEVVTGDPAALRALLARTSANVVRAVVVSTAHRGTAVGAETVSSRVYRRSEVMWSGSLHEQLVARPGHRLVLAPEQAPVRLLHSGYQVTTMHERGKAERNLRIARAAAEALAPGDPRAADVWGDCGRSLVQAGMLDEAVDAFENVLQLGAGPHTSVIAGRSAVLTLLQLQRYDDAERWIAALEGAESSGALALWRARVALGRGDLPGARSALRDAVSGTDPWGVRFDPATATTTAVLIDVEAGDHEAAERTLRHQIATAPDHVHLRLLVQHASETGRPLAGYLAGCPASLVERSLREAVLMDGDTADRWLTALHETRPADLGPIVAGCVVAARHTLEARLRWSVVAREAGITDPCPLRLHATDEQAPPASRCLAWAVLADACGEEDARAEWLALLPAVPDDELPLLGALLEELAPGLLVAT
ncbi:glycosyltransferase family 2 protein [Quadrisphaera sp. DSM 44207]|uniref:tetratricopeptide repeat-containing glycosyltransferase family 2 protein n=1 Tax=Quadrisphaera sp. DSM 44207 TaxID=1881057 RepID=UPI000884BE15|nr:glycosyltransferase family 2 protein [Quadrisphaera sp. DSM 44207]SDQ20310.1 Glycosyl transferase family 2 [Quadrisphaera sp. DSM 44207]